MAAPGRHEKIISGLPVTIPVTVGHSQENKQENQEKEDSSEDTVDDGRGDGDWHRAQSTHYQSLLQIWKSNIFKLRLYKVYKC